MRPDFSKIEYRTSAAPVRPAAPEDAPVWQTAEHIAVKTAYTAP